MICTTLILISSLDIIARYHRYISSLAAPVAEWVMRPPGSALAWGPKARGFKICRGQHYI
ncbi:hypothetical protein I7I53_05838 [Histoplasma capsulatum var. duboisii H88]|uniref:Uncharacterized protein n=1 Tax=Ajellomyces capsulatus (strain H88) TaxID=544711 RepID=A0A8A1L9U2_AJEC8|nr:hypothetical protein I7I53_05838 [Histoplasma capsulatum var. duboisii H88]